MNINLPELSEGETYIGCIGDALGNLRHVILLPGDNLIVVLLMPGVLILIAGLYLVDMIFGEVGE